MSLKLKIIQKIDPKLIVFFKKSGWYGNFKSWEEAENETDGYSNEDILSKVKDSLNKVINKEAIFERDSVLFNQVEYNFPILSTLLWVAAKNKGNLNLIDFGGSLGSTYFQHRFFFNDLCTIKWNVVEQENFVEVGNSEFKSSILSFYKSIEEVSNLNEINCILFSSVLQYLSNPFEIIEQAINKNIEIIIIDKTSFTLNNTERITVQKVNKKIYDASYPCRFFSKDKFLKFFIKNNYELMYEIKSDDYVNIPSEFNGFVFIKKK